MASLNLKTIYHQRNREAYLNKLSDLTLIKPEDPRGDQFVVQILKDFYYMTTNSRKEIPYTELLNNFATELAQIFGWMASQVLKIDKYKNFDIKLLEAQKSSQVRLKKCEVVFLLCLMCLNLVPLQDHQHSRTYKFASDKNFAYVFSNVQFKTISIITYIKHYFKKTHEKQANEVLTITRKVCFDKISSIINQFEKAPLCEVKIGEQWDDIDKFPGGYKVDFANKKIGGGSMKEGAVQEQILFANHPEMFIAILLCEEMEENEALQFIGFRKYYISEGYGKNKTKLKGFFMEKYAYDQIGQAKEYIIAIDAIDYSKYSIKQQYTKKCINRDILKAYTGFIDAPVETVVTGKWGCGAFKGDDELKFLIQWIAASIAGKRLYYCPFSDPRIFESFINFGNYTIGDIYKAITNGDGLFSTKRTDYYQQLKKMRKPGVYQSSIN